MLRNRPSRYLSPSDVIMDDLQEPRPASTVDSGRTGVRVLRARVSVPCWLGRGGPPGLPQAEDTVPNYRA